MSLLYVDDKGYRLSNVFKEFQPFHETAVHVHKPFFGIRKHLSQLNKQLVVRFEVLIVALVGGCPTDTMQARSDTTILLVKIPRINRRNG